MDLEHSLSTYRIFNAVAETGSISYAAKLLYISQPAISKAVIKLEHALHVTLFQRSSKGVQLTEEGKLLYSYTKPAFDTLEAGEDTLRRVNTLGIGHIRIGASATLCKFLLLPYIKCFLSQNPHIRFTIQCQSTIQTLDLLQDGKIDVGLVGKPDITESYDYFCIGAVEDIFAASPAYLENLTIREAKPLTARQILKASNLMLLDEKNITRVYLEDYFCRNHIEKGQILEVSSMDLLIEFAKTGLGIACVIREFIQPEIEAELLKEVILTPFIKKREVGFVSMQNRLLPESVKKFIEFYKNDELQQITV